MEETKIEKLEEVAPQTPVFNADAFKKEMLEEMKKMVDAAVPKKEEMAEKKTVQKASNTNENKILMLKRQYSHLSDDAVKHLVHMKDNRKFVETEDGMTVSRVEETW